MHPRGVGSSLSFRPKLRISSLSHGDKGNKENGKRPCNAMANAMASVCPTPFKRHEAAVVAFAGCVTHFEYGVNSSEIVLEALQPVCFNIQYVILS